MDDAMVKDSAGCPFILEIKGNALDDGPGIRTVVFFKGCPLSCTWCHNPESKKAGLELSFDSEKCIGCGACREACKSGALETEYAQGPDRDLCVLCMACTQVCPALALEAVGRTMTMDAIVATVAKDRPFYDASGGGVTLSGGEPTLNPEFCGQLLRQLRTAGIHTLLETCGHFSWPAFETAVLPHVNTIYCDIKLMDPKAHVRYCGVSNRRILENVTKLLALSLQGELDFLPRVPLVPGVTATDENISAIAEFLSAHGARMVQVMAYNPLWHGKSRKIGGDVGGVDDARMHAFMAREEVRRLSALFEARGLAVV